MGDIFAYKEWDAFVSEKPGGVVEYRNSGDRTLPTLILKPSFITMLRVVPRTVARSAPRRAARSVRGYAHHAGHVEELVVGGNPTKEYLANRANIEHHAAGE